MANVHCEFCGAQTGDRVTTTPEKFVAWVHKCKDVVRCAKHEKSSKTSESCRSHDPITGARKLTSQEEFQAMKAARAAKSDYQI